jgi:hypothetical protein
MMMSLNTQVAWLFLLALPIACVAWTVTREEIFSELNAYCKDRCETSKSLLARKFFYLFTCEYCFSHYVTILFLILTKFTLLLTGWKGYIIAGFSLVWVANFYMTIYSLLRSNLKNERLVSKLTEEELKERDNIQAASSPQEGK